MNRPDPDTTAKLAIDSLARGEWRRAKKSAHRARSFGLRIPRVYLSCMRDAVAAFLYVWAE